MRVREWVGNRFEKRLPTALPHPRWPIPPFHAAWESRIVGEWRSRRRTARQDHCRAEKIKKRQAKNWKFRNPTPNNHTVD